jgi:methionyl-tRNA formyltransferase
VHRVIFMGTPEFALPALQAAHELADVVAVVAQPDRPAGRGQKTIAPPVARWAQAHGVRLLQPPRLRDPVVLEDLAELAPALIVVAAYGKILPRVLLDLPSRGCVNVHASLLPKYRGAAPVQWAIARGETVTGVSLMRMEEGLDTGAVYVQESLPIDVRETGGSLTAKLSALGGTMLARWLPALLDGTLPAVPQDEAASTLAPKLTREDALIDFRRPASEVESRVRAFQPWPGAVALLPEGTRLKVLSAIANLDDSGRPGEVLAGGPEQILVACGEGALALEIVQPEGRRAMAAAEFLAGHALPLGTLLGSS